MSGDGEDRLERRFLRRRLTRWRVLAIVALGIAAAAAFGRFGIEAGPHVALVKIEGLILADDDQLGLLARLAGDDRVKAVILAIDSPGGTVVGGETLYLAIGRLRAAKPVVATIGSLGTSAAYLAAIGADHVLARETSLTGSIGVLLQAPEFSALLATLGIKVNEIKSAPLKATPSPFEALSPDKKAALQAVIDDSFDWFKTLVSARRKLAGAALDKVTDGRVFTGRQAVALGLIDGLGGVAEARAWLSAERGVPGALPTTKVEPDTDFGLDTLLSGKSLVPKWLTLDGLVAVWHPRMN